MENFKSYIPAEKSMPEMTVTAIVAGALLAVVFGAANAYLGLRVGMTVSASIPAAVIGMGVIRGLFRKSSILESNMIQTIGSAGESLAAGCIFTIPALFLWAKEGITGAPGLATVTAIALAGGILGCLFMIPLRASIIVKEHGVLPYPEAQACTKVLLAGEKESNGVFKVFGGMGFAAVVKFITDAIAVIPASIGAKISGLKTEINCGASTALVGVGYIIGLRTSAITFCGSVLAWFVMIPLIVMFGGDTVVFPKTVSIAEVYANGGAGAIWSSYIRYIGAGALTMAGLISLAKSLPLIISTFHSAIKGMKGAKTDSSIRTEKDLDFKVIIIGAVIVLAALVALPFVQAGILSAIIILILGFFFAVVSAKIVGIVGSSNCPASGMTIACLLIATIIFKVAGDTGTHGLISAITVGSVICVIICIANDTSQDLKTGFLVGATPKKQQIGELIGVVVSAFSIGGVLILLDKAFGFGSENLAAPQAMLMKMVTEGVMTESLPWALIFVGAACAVIFELLGISSLAAGIGIYLPVETTAAMFIGGLIRWFINKKNKNASEESSDGILFSSGMIAGEGLMGVIIAILAVAGVLGKINLSKYALPQVSGLILLIVICALLIKVSLPKKNEK